MCWRSLPTPKRRPRSRACSPRPDSGHRGSPCWKRSAARANASAPPRRRISISTNIDPLNTVAIEVAATPGARIIARAAGLPDALFEHDGQITKREIRALTLSALAPRRGETLWDIGAGAGSVAIEWMLADVSLRAVAIEANAERAARIARNAAAFGVPGLRVVHGTAPDAFVTVIARESGQSSSHQAFGAGAQSSLASTRLTGCPACAGHDEAEFAAGGSHQPDAIFVGGGAGDAGVLEAAVAALRGGGRLVVNAVTLQTEALLIARHAALGGTLTRIAIERAEPIGAMTTWRPALPVTQWGWVKPMEKP